MPSRVIILQSKDSAAQTLGAFFRKRGYKVWQTGDPTKAFEWVKSHQPDLVLLDLHMPGNVWLEILAHVNRQLPDTSVILTNRHPDVHRELLAKERGAHVFLREPFTDQWIEKALDKVAGRGEPVRPTPRKSDLPRVKVPMRVKLTVPFALLAMLFAVAAVYLGSRFILESFRERFTNQLIDAGTLAADWMVQEEIRMLDSLRLIANTEGVAEAIQSRDAGRLREITLPLAINYREEAVEVLDLNGISVLSLRHRPDGAVESYESFQTDTVQSEWQFVRKILDRQADQVGDKFSGLVNAPWGNYFYIAGPVFKENRLVGVLLVGKSVETMARQMRQDTLAQITLYDLNGAPQASTVLVPEEIPGLPEAFTRGVLKRQDQESLVRDLSIASASYSEILAAWEARWGEDLGVIGTSLTQNFLVRPSTFTRVQAFFIIAVTFVGVIVLGAYLAKQVTTPLSQVVHASTQVAQGNLEVKVHPRGNDEVAVLAHAFNHMITGLQEGSIYRDLLGRTVSPEVREALRESFASGDLRLEGQTTTSTVLMSDIRGFTSLSENEEPTTVLTWLNEYFGELVPVVTEYGGVVDKFEGDAMLAFFGILPTPLSPEESAYQACRAAAEMVSVIERINQRRAKRGEPALVTGICINTGPLTAGGLGTSDRLNYTIIGDTVNTAHRMQAISREFGETGVVVSEATLTQLKEKRVEFQLEPLGEHAFKGKQSQLWLYRLWLSKNESNLNTLKEAMQPSPAEVTGD
jgi:class 3 adenylate cyclase/CheY-like chemotaxis protein/HAMP domain-containing protein